MLKNIPAKTQATLKNKYGTLSRTKRLIARRKSICQPFCAKIEVIPSCLRKTNTELRRKYIIIFACQTIYLAIKYS